MKLGRSFTQPLRTLMLIAVLLVTGWIIITPYVHATATIRLKFATLYPKQDPNCLGAQYMFEELEKRTNGRVKITPFYSQSLGKAQEMLDMLDKGVADIALFPPGEAGGIGALGAFLIALGKRRLTMKNITLALIVAFPQISLFLPNAMC